jgi:hypothetical protein
LVGQSQQLGINWILDNDSMAQKCYLCVFVNQKWGYRGCAKSCNFGIDCTNATEWIGGREADEFESDQGYD